MNDHTTAQMNVIDARALLAQAQTIDIPKLRDALPALLERNFDSQRYGDLHKWQQALAAFPAITPSSVDLASAAVRIGSPGDCHDDIRAQLDVQLRVLHPWRKGPFDFFGIHIDTEWRSDLKWDRLKESIKPLKNKRVLDVGCGNGYHCWRLRGAGAREVIGIEPMPLYVMQFQAAQHNLRDHAVHVLPAKLEELPCALKAFDTTLSMGVLYHRREPLDHLAELKDTLKPGGELVLETLVINGKRGEMLAPAGRYGQMNNVHSLPSTGTLDDWLTQTGFTDIRCIDVNVTTGNEQRSTPWMTFQSLQDFLDPTDNSRTVEGYPAPRRAIFIAQKPV